MILIEKAFTDFEKMLLHSLRKAPLPLRPYLSHLSNALGKNLRGRALILAAMDEQGHVHSDAVKLAVSIELFHLATLVHDDIIDDADIRRGQESLHRKFGRKQAVLSGDYLFAQAIEVSLSIDPKRSTENFSISSYARLVCVGEIRQGANNFNLDLSIYRYLSIIRGKTAMLFEAAFAGGAWILGDEENFDSYRRLGRYIGMIFQMMDDLIDIEQSEATAKKPILSDLREGVITLPLIFAMKADPKIREKILSEKEAIDTVAIREMIFRAKGDQKTRAVADRYYKHALTELESLPIGRSKREQLRMLLDKAAGH
ncbi:MAG: polyprenyl synthetase family protein [Peptostreptococcaceae bacterium]|nr:polyprenyl synthetase family protein [Peptostreptococcaceae bacterium]